MTWARWAGDNKSRHGIAVLLRTNYSFRTYCYRMPKPLKTLPVSTPDPKGVFERGAKVFRVGLYAHVSTYAWALE